jgi:hypothetical protein
MKPTTFLSIIGISILFLFAYIEFDNLNSKKSSEEPKIISSYSSPVIQNEETIAYSSSPDIRNEYINPKTPIRFKSKRKSCFELNESTIALWRFNGDRATSFINEKNNVMGSFKGNPTVVEGKFGNAVHFDGIDDYGNCNFDPPEKNCTYEIWYKPDAQADENGWVWMGWGLYNSGLIVNQNNVALCEFNAVKKKKDNFSLKPNAWNYVVYVFSDNKELQALYINGEKVSNLEISRHESTWNTLWLAADMTYGANHFLKGTIDEFRISNKTLTEKEIKNCWRKNN